MISVYNFIMMDDEQIEKFIKLYGEGDEIFRLRGGSLNMPKKMPVKTKMARGLNCGQKM